MRDANAEQTEEATGVSAMPQVNAGCEVQGLDRQDANSEYEEAGLDFLLLFAHGEQTRKAELLYDATPSLTTKAKFTRDPKIPIVEVLAQYAEARGIGIPTVGNSCI